MHSNRRPGFVNDLGIRLLILTLSAILLMAMQQTGQLRPLQDMVLSLTSPTQISATGFTQLVLDGVETLGSIRTAQQRVAELDKINNSLVVEILGLREVELENERLRSLLQFAQTRPSFELRGGQIIARVIGWDPHNYLQYVMLDLGSRHGIEVGMPVLTNEGLVGRISEVSGSISKVLLISDPNSSVNAIMHSSRLNGMIRGRPGMNPVMDFIPQGEVFSVGEIVLTSGLGSRFPKGIPIGQVVEIQQRDFEESQQAVIRPTVDFSQLELVMVITNFDPLEELADSYLPQTRPEPAGAEESAAPGSGQTDAPEPQLQGMPQGAP